MNYWDDPVCRLMQVFFHAVSGKVFEVYLNTSTDLYVCTCPGFERKAQCVHVDYVNDHTHPDAGYPMKIENADANALKELAPDHKAFRQFILEHAQVVNL